MESVCACIFFLCEHSFWQTDDQRRKKRCFIPEVLRVDPSVEGLGARLLLGWGAGDDEEEEEEEEDEEAAGEEVRAADRVGAGEASRSPDSISVKHNPISRVTIAKHTHPYTCKHTCLNTHTHAHTPMNTVTPTQHVLANACAHTHLLTLLLSHFTSPEQYFYLAMLTGSRATIDSIRGKKETSLKILKVEDKASFWVVLSKKKSLRVVLCNKSCSAQSSLSRCWCGIFGLAQLAKQQQWNQNRYFFSVIPSSWDTQGKICHQTHM